MPVTKQVIIYVTLVVLCGCDTEPPVAGSMSKTSVCNTAGYLIRKELGTGFKTIDQQCSVINTGGNNVEIESGYVSPINPNALRYTAKGYVRGNTLVLQQIRVHGVDEKFIRFTSLGG